MKRVNVELKQLRLQRLKIPQKLHKFFETEFEQFSVKLAKKLNAERININIQ